MFTESQIGVGCTTPLSLGRWTLKLKLGKCFTRVAPGGRGSPSLAPVPGQGCVPLIHMAPNLEDAQVGGSVPV